MTNQRKKQEVKPYQTPQVVVYGNIREITNNAPKGQKNDSSKDRDKDNKTG